MASCGSLRCKAWAISFLYILLGVFLIFIGLFIGDGADIIIPITHIAAGGIHTIVGILLITNLSIGNRHLFCIILGLIVGLFIEHIIFSGVIIMKMIYKTIDEDRELGPEEVFVDEVNNVRTIIARDIAPPVIFQITGFFVVYGLFKNSARTQPNVISAWNNTDWYR